LHPHKAVPTIRQMPGIVAKSTASGVLFASRINDRFNPMKPIKFNLTILIVGSTLLLAGCSDNWCWPFDCESSSSGVETPDTVATTATANPVTETQTTNAVAETDFLTVRRADIATRMIRINSHNHYTALRSKLGWG